MKRGTETITMFKWPYVGIDSFLWPIGKVKGLFMNYLTMVKWPYVGIDSFLWPIGKVKGLFMNYVIFFGPFQNPAL